MRRPHAESRRPQSPRMLLIAAALSLIVTSAYAQDSGGGAQAKPAPQAVAPNPIVVQRVHDQFFVAPEYKLTDMNGRTGQLVGGSGGILMQQTFVFGGALYHLVDGPSDWELTYGGFTFGVQMPPEKRIRFGARSLIGFGSASNVASYTFPISPPYPVPYYGRGHMTVAPVGFHAGYPGNASGARVQYEENFFVFEPQGDLVFAISDKIRFGASAGYRWTDSSDYFQRAINGVTGTFMLQVGF
jgi:hypothetical protein